MATVEVRFAFSSVDPDPTSRESPGQAPHRLDGLDELRGLEEARRRSCRDGCELHPSPVEFGDSRSVGDPRMSEVPGQLAQPAQPKVPIFTSAVHGGSLKGTDVSEQLASRLGEEGSATGSRSSAGVSRLGRSGVSVALAQTNGSILAFRVGAGIAAVATLLPLLVPIGPPVGRKRQPRRSNWSRPPSDPQPAHRNNASPRAPSGGASARIANSIERAVTVSTRLRGFVHGHGSLAAWTRVKVRSSAGNRVRAYSRRTGPFSRGQSIPVPGD